MTESALAESEATQNVRDSDLLRVLVALAGRIACPPEQLLEIVGPYAEAYNLCTGELTLASIARATGVDKGNLHRAMARWEQAGALFRIGPQGRPLRLYSLPVQSERRRPKGREATKAVTSADSVDGEQNGQEQL